MASNLTQQKSADPAIRTPAPQPSPVEMDMPAHIATYNMFLNILKWFIVHLAILMTGLYFVIIANNPTFGMILVLVAIGAFFYGVLRNPKSNQDVSAAIAGGPIAE